MDFIDSVRFSKFERFELLMHFSGKQFAAEAASNPHDHKGTVGYCPFDLSPMAKLIMSAKCSIKNGLCSTGLSANKAGLPAGR